MPINQSFLPSLISAALTLGFAVLGLILVQLFRRRLKGLLNRIHQITGERRQQLYTLLMVGTWAISIIIILVAGLMILGLWIDITPVLTGMGVVGLALGLGSQTLVKDFLGGFFILLENQYAVGDVIRVNSVSGEVELITLRVTHLRDRNGHLHIIPNGDIRIVSNLTREWSRAIINVEITLNDEEDLDRVMEILDTALTHTCEEAALKEDLLSTPTLIGPNGIESGKATLQILAQTVAGHQWQVTEALQRSLHSAFRRASIKARLTGSTPMPE